MRKILMGGLAVVFLATPLCASADTLSDLQAEVQQLVAQIASIKSQLNISSVSTTNTTSSTCLTLYGNLYQGESDTSTNGAVTELQQFLGISPATGYFGSLTLQAVQQWQSAHGVISSGTPGTTGYGSVGPMTRFAMKCNGLVPVSNTNMSCTWNGQTIGSGQAVTGYQSSSVAYGLPCISLNLMCSNGTMIGASDYPYASCAALSPTPQYSSAFSASPTSGMAPLTVTFTNVGDSICYGEGPCMTVTNNGNIGTTQYIYHSAGTYTATSNGSNITITVTGNTLNPSATVDQSSLSATANTPFTLSGSASGGVQSVQVSILHGVGTNSNVFQSGIVPVTNGRWQVNVASGLPAWSENYTVGVQGYYDAAGTQGIAASGMLTSGSLTVSGSVTTTTGFSASSTSGSAPLSVRFSAPQDPNDSINFGDGSVWYHYTSGTATNIYTMPGTYIAQLVNNSPCTGVVSGSGCMNPTEILSTVTITVTGSNSSQSSATIDQNSLMSRSPTVTLTGTAANVKVVAAQFSVSNGIVNFPPAYVDSTGRWSTTIAAGSGCGGGCGGVSPGTYQISVYDFSSGVIGARLATGTLTVTNGN